MPDLPENRRHRHRQERRRRSSGWVIVAGAAALLLVAATVVTVVVLGARGGPLTPDPSSEPDAAEPIAFPADEPAASAGDDPCTIVRVVSSYENAEMVSRLVDGYNAQPRDVDGNCVSVVAT